MKPKILILTLTLFTTLGLSVYATTTWHDPTFIKTNRLPNTSELTKIKENLSYLKRKVDSSSVINCRICYEIRNESLYSRSTQRRCSGWGNTSSPAWTPYFRNLIYSTSTGFSSAPIIRYYLKYSTRWKVECK